MRTAGPDAMDSLELSTLFAAMVTDELHELCRAMAAALGEGKQPAAREDCKKWLTANLTAVSTLRRIYQKLSFDEQIFLNETLAHEGFMPALWYFRIKYQRDSLVLLYYRLYQRDSLLNTLIYPLNPQSPATLFVIPREICSQLNKFVKFASTMRLETASQFPPFSFMCAEHCLLDVCTTLNLAATDTLRSPAETKGYPTKTLSKINGNLMTDEPVLFKSFSLLAAESRNLSIRVQGLVDLLVMAELLCSVDGSLRPTLKVEEFLLCSPQQQLDWLYQGWMTASGPDELTRLDGIYFADGVFDQGGVLRAACFKPRLERNHAIIQALSKIQTEKWITIDSFIRKFGLTCHDFLRDSSFPPDLVFYASSHETEIQREIRTNYDRWLALEGNYLMAVFFGYLANLGLMNIGFERLSSGNPVLPFPAQQPLISRFQAMKMFQLTEIGQYLLNKIPKLKSALLPKVWPIQVVEDNRLVINERLITQEDLDFLTKVAEKLTGPPLSFTLTLETLNRAIPKHCSAHTILSFLRKRMHPSDYLKLKELVMQWRSRYEPFNLDKVYLISAKKAAQLSRLVKDSEASIVVKRISPKRALLRTCDLAVIKRYCLKRGFNLTIRKRQSD